MLFSENYQCTREICKTYFIFRKILNMFKEFVNHSKNFKFIDPKVVPTFLTFKYILNDQVALSDDDQQRNMSPCEQTELFHVILFDQREHKPNEADAVQTE